MKIKAKKGDVVAIHFDDHVEDASEPMKCVVYGKLVSRGPKYVTVEAWTADAENNKTFTILTSCIRGYCILQGEWGGEPPDVLR